MGPTIIPLPLSHEPVTFPRVKLPSDLAAWFAANGATLLGYSGGVDSTVLAVVGNRVLGPRHFLAVIGRSPSYPDVQWKAATDQAKRHQVPLLEIDTEELGDPSYRANSTDRCYFCKRELWSKLVAIGRERGIRTIIDGTHADDRSDHRPGGRAGAEAGIRSPLAELGWGKAQIRATAQAIGITVWDAPASPCLSSRIRYGLEVTPERLSQVDRAEAFLRGLGVVGDLRVRHLGDHARIEATGTMAPLLETAWPVIEAEFRAIGFQRVERDPRGYRRGSLLPVAE